VSPLETVAEWQILVKWEGAQHLPWGRREWSFSSDTTNLNFTHFTFAYSAPNNEKKEMLSSHIIIVKSKKRRMLKVTKRATRAI